MARSAAGSWNQVCGEVVRVEPGNAGNSHGPSDWYATEKEYGPWPPPPGQNLPADARITGLTLPGFNQVWVAKWDDKEVVVWAHEFGHALGKPHMPTGIMEQGAYEGLYEPGGTSLTAGAIKPEDCP
jgi:hypothetical protein